MRRHGPAESVCALLAAATGAAEHCLTTRRGTEHALSPCSHRAVQLCPHSASSARIFVASKAQWKVIDSRA